MLKRGLVNELIRCTKQPSQQTDSLKHRLVNELIPCTTQPRQ
jgi:2-oxoglutarate dehydrogenase complex dehydrogenase (E1) component-like enzyme